MTDADPRSPESPHAGERPTARPARTAIALWVAGARPRTLPAALSPVLVGTSIAYWTGSAIWGRAVLCLVVAVALQVGVNYANDYSDGIRGTDSARVGPVRLVGQGLAAPTAVKRAAMSAFAVAASAGLALVAMSGLWWLLAVGGAAIVAAWTYTGGPRPYGYVGLGEVFVFVFFGLVAVCGTVVVQAGSVDLLAWLSGAAVGAMSCAILVANNLRDIPGDTAAGKRTLAVRIADPRTRVLYQVLVLAALSVPLTTGVLGLARPESWPRLSLLGLLTVLVVVDPVRRVRSGATGRQLVIVLAETGRALLVFGLTFGLGIALSAV